MGDIQNIKLLLCKYFIENSRENVIYLFLSEKLSGPNKLSQEERGGGTGLGRCPAVRVSEMKNWNDFSPSKCAKNLIWNMHK